MRVHYLKRRPTRNANVGTCKVVFVGEGIKVTEISYHFQQKKLSQKKMTHF
jgi:hypothetical protein